MKRIRHIFEALGLLAGIAVLRLLTPEAASNLGAFVCRNLGPRVSVSDRARRNLRLAMPELSAKRIEEIVAGMWDNLGRTFAEYPHLGRIADPKSGRVILPDSELMTALAEPGQARILCSAHIANWEILPVAAAYNGIDMTSIVREPNNPLVRATLDRIRGVAGGGRTPKGGAGAKESIKVLRNGRVLALLFDQKLNRGLSIPFFGIEAMTTAAPAQLALRFRCPLILMRIERTGPARFRLSAREPLALPDSGDKQRDAELVMKQMNTILEEWIRARPEQWLWLHRRWPPEAYQAAETKRGNSP
jgi:Kdo2-lipid IVA lauroyltransferase/acyltransferase